MNKEEESLEEAAGLVKTADHLIYLSFPLLQDKRILLKALVKIKESMNICISLILRYEYLNKRIRLYKDPKKNFKVFKDTCARKYEITNQEVNKIVELFEIAEHQEKSSMEFMKDNRVIILSEKMEKKEINLEKAKDFLLLTKNILKKTKENLEINIKTQKPL